MRRFAGVILVDAKGRLLLQERDEHAPIDPDCWGLPGGHVEDGETFEQAAYRELAEETAVALAPGTLTAWRQIEVYHAISDSVDQMAAYVAGCELTDADIVVGEGRQIVFVLPEQARMLPLTAAASQIVPEFLDSEDYRRLLGRQSP